MKRIWISLRSFIFFTVLTGLIYPLMITLVSDIFFQKEAGGSLVKKDGKVIGSILIGQEFKDPRYFSTRPSNILYNPLPSGGSNLALTSVKLKSLVSERKKEFIRVNDLDSSTAVPSEMLFASASELDPDISPGAALLQVNRISKARHFDRRQEDNLKKLIRLRTENPQFHLLGEPRINVFLLNLSLDSIR